MEEETKGGTMWNKFNSKKVKSSCKEMCDMFDLVLSVQC